MIGQLGKFLGHWSHWGSCYLKATQKVKEKIAGFPQLKVALLISPWSQDAFHEKEEHDGGSPAKHTVVMSKMSLSPLGQSVL